jgi:hypothetical protein
MVPEQLEGKEADARTDILLSANWLAPPGPLKWRTKLQ